MHKRVSSVTPEPLGDETTAALLTGVTLIELSNSGDFYEDGGHALIAGEVYAYSAVEEGEDDDTPEPSITLDTGLLADIPVGTPVEVWNPDTGAVVVDWMVEVTDDTDGSAGVAYLDHALIPLLPEGLPPGVGDSVVVTVDDFGDWHVTGILGRSPMLNAAFIGDADTPADVPVLTVVGLLETFLLRTSPISATTLLTYQVSVNAGVDWDDLPDMPVRSTIIEAKHLPDETPFETDTDYVFRVVASNTAGTGGTSNEVTAQLDTSAASVVASQVVAGEVLAGFALLGTVHVGGDTFTLTPPGVDPDNLPGGLRIELTDGGLIHLPADGSPATFSGNVIADSLVIINGAQINGASNLSGQISMDSAIADPTDAPTVNNNYESVTTSVTSPTGFCRNVADDGWVIATGGSEILYEVDDDGVTVNSVDVPTAAGGITKIGSSYYVKEAGARIRVFDSALVAGALLSISEPAGFPAATIGTDGTNIVVAYDISGSTYEIRRYTTAGADVDSVTGLSSAGAGLGGVYRGSADFGAARWVVHPTSANVRVYTVGGTRQTAEEWPRPHNNDVEGLWWDGTYFWVIDNSGVIRRLEPIADAPAADYDWAYAWQDSDTHTTLVSPTTTHTRKARARIAVTGSTAPQQGTAGTHVANRIAIYGATTAGTKRLQGGAALAVGTKKLTLTQVTTSGAVVPASNNWSAVFVPAILSADAGGFTIDGSSNGSVGTGTFRDSGIAAIPAASETVAGKAEIATQTATNTGTDDARIVTPLKLQTRMAAYAAPALVETNVQTGTTYTLALTDARKVVQGNHATGITITIPANSTVAFPVGTVVEVLWRGAGTTTVATAGGVTLNGKTSGSALTSVNLSARYGMVRLWQRAADAWIITGDFV
jgi:hypothetical protein